MGNVKLSFDLSIKGKPLPVYGFGNLNATDSLLEPNGTVYCMRLSVFCCGKSQLNKFKPALRNDHSMQFNIQ